VRWFFGSFNPIYKDDLTEKKYKERDKEGAEIAEGGGCVEPNTTTSEKA
jgi:hypothetical protein